MNPVYNNATDYEGPAFGFEKLEVRMSFIKKVYLILSVQLLATAGAVALSIYSDTYRGYLIDYQWTLGIALVLNIVTAYALMCYRSVARRVPLNYVLLAVFTGTEAYIISMLTMFFEPEIVFIAAVLTAGIVVSLTLYAVTTKTDFTMLGGLLFMLGMTLILASLLGMFFHQWLPQLLIACFAVVLFGLYLIYDTQLVVGGRAHELSIDDYIVGAMVLYIDIVRIFVELLRILAIANSRRN